MISRQLKNFFVAVACVVFATTIAHAQQVVVSPLRVTFKNDLQSEIISIRNTSKQSFTVQPKVLRWSQKDGKDVFDATRDILVAPPIVEVPAGETQVIRLALKRAPEAGSEMSYRIFIQQVAVPAKEGTTALAFSWSLSLPIFVSATDAAVKPALQWTGTSANKVLTLNATNNGSMHIQVKRIRVESSVGVSESDQMFYLLPAQQQKLALTVPGGLGKSVVLIADTDAGEIRQEVSLQ
jgi:fimbrial chaperone protein